MAKKIIIVEKICIVCFEVFSNVKWRMKGRIVCSRSCQVKLLWKTGKGKSSWGRKMSDKTRSAIRKSLSGKNNPNWKDRPTYGIVHYWLRTTYGKAYKCHNEECLGKSSKFEWALIKGKKYLRKRENFWMLCKKCHSRYDFKGKLRGEKPRCLDCKIQLKDWAAKRCYRHAQQYRFKHD